MSWLSDMFNSIFRLKSKDSEPDIGNVFEDLRERVTNPFLSSYAISFIICNWKVWVALLFEQSYIIRGKGDT